MKYSIRISAKATQDAIIAIDYYDVIMSTIGDKFIAELNETYQKILTNPFLYSYIFTNPADKFRDVKLKSSPTWLYMKFMNGT